MEAARLEARAVGRARLIRTAVLGHRAAEGELAAGVGARHAVIDDARGGIRTIDGGRAVPQDLDALDQGARHRVDIHRQRGHAVLGHRDRMWHEAAAVEQGKGATRADAAQVDRGDVAAGQLRAIIDLGNRRRLGYAEGLEQLRHRGGATSLKIHRLQHGHRQGGLRIGAADVGAGNHEGLQTDRLGRRFRGAGRRSHLSRERARGGQQEDGKGSRQGSHAPPIPGFSRPGASLNRAGNTTVTDRGHPPFSRFFLAVGLVPEPSGMS